METKSLLYGLIGFILGGLLVSVAATTFDKPATTNEASSMSQTTSSLQTLQGDEFDKAYISNMIYHHQSAVDMAKLAEERAKHQEIKTLSNDIISSQQTEINEMKSWQNMWEYTQPHESTEH